MRLVLNAALEFGFVFALHPAAVFLCKTCPPYEDRAEERKGMSAPLRAHGAVTEAGRPGHGSISLPHSVGLCAATAVTASFLVLYRDSFCRNVTLPGFSSCPLVALSLTCHSSAFG